MNERPQAPARRNPPTRINHSSGTSRVTNGTIDSPSSGATVC